jgi:hypothetical protein
MVSKRLETAKKFISFFEALDSKILEAILAPNYTHEFAPTSLCRAAGLGVRDRAGFINHTSHIGDIMTSFPVTAKEYIESDKGNQVVVWATSEAKWRDDVKGDGAEAEWAYEGEYVFMLTMDESGDKIVKTVEFLDSKQTADRLMGLMKRARENKAKRGE